MKDNKSHFTCCVYFSVLQISHIKAVGRQPVTAEARFQSQTSLWVAYFGPIDGGTCYYF